MYLKGNSVLEKGWYFLQTYILTLRRFDLFLQGTFLIVILLESNAYLLLRRDDGDSFIPAAVEDWVMLGAGGVEFLLGAVLAWYGGRKRNYALSVCLTAAAASGLIVLAFPYKRTSPADVELCGVSSLNPVEDPNLTPRTVFLILTVLLCTLTKVSVWAHGLTYLDDHDPKNGPYFYGILISIRMSLGLSGQNWLINSSRFEDWWVPQLSISMLTLMFAFLFPLFPKRMKEFEEDVAPRDFLLALNRVMTNKVIILQTIALSLLSAAVFGFIHYDRAYTQASFNVEAYRQDPQTSRTLSDIFRSLVIIFFVMIFRVRFSLCRADGVKATTASRVGGVAALFVAAFLAAIAVLGCDGGVDTRTDYTQPDCSSNCGCDSMRYGMSPVCSIDSSETYFSPCHAGCSQQHDLNGFFMFSNCTCGGGVWTRGACREEGACRTAFGAYQVLYTVMLAVAGFLQIPASSLMMQGMVILRAVRRTDKPIAMGFSIATVGMLAFVFGHAAYMGISYATCAYLNGIVCVLHKQVVWTMPASSAVLAALAAGLSLYTSTARPTLEPTTEL